LQKSRNAIKALFAKSTTKVNKKNKYSEKNKRNIGKYEKHA
jgi:hypothetical protein